MHGRNISKGEESALLQRVGQIPWLATDFTAPALQPIRKPKPWGGQHRPSGRLVATQLTPTVKRRQYLPITDPSEASHGLIKDAIASEHAKQSSRPERVGIEGLRATSVYAPDPRPSTSGIQGAVDSRPNRRHNRR